MGSLVNRLDKLEKDLYMLSAMQHLLVESELTGSADHVEEVEIPTRDTSVSNPKKVPKKCPARKPLPVLPSNLKPNASEFQCNGNMKDSIVQKECNENQEQQRVDDMTRKVVELEAKIELEKERRVDEEESREKLLLNFQKKEEELERERDCKNGLLRLTLQMKTQLQEREVRISSFEKDVQLLQEEKTKMQKDLETLRKNSEKFETESRNLLERNDSLEKEQRKLLQNLADLAQSQKEDHRSYELKEQSAVKQEQKLLNQVNQLIGKCAQVEESRQRLVVENSQLKDRFVQKTTEVQELLEKVSKLETEMEGSTLLHESELRKLQAESKHKEDEVNQKVASCHYVLTQTKKVFLKLSSEKEELEQSLASETESNRVLRKNLEESEKSLVEAKKMAETESQRLNALVRNAEGTIRKLKDKNHDLQRLNLKLKLENAQMEKQLKSGNEKFASNFKHADELKCRLEDENSSLRKEVKNTTDNFSILQKISEDQINSIQKLKSEIEEHRKSESSLKRQMRDLEDALEVSNQKSTRSEQHSAELEEEVEYLQQRLNRLEDDLKNHSCEDFVESTSAKKLASLENQIKTQQSKWEASVEKLRIERDKAMAAAKRAVNKAMEMRSVCEAKVLEIQSNAKQEELKAQVESRREICEKDVQVQNLKTELDKVRQDSAQSQRTLTQKIHQLQSALNICVGSFSQQSFPQQTPFNLPTPSFGSFNF